uniref:(northern house mosquito) hypothetical protein n=1 Tax=Culex pipiens TaxID=7175 RepID=A0A8D8B9M4_CULPI
MSIDYFCLRILPFGSGQFSNSTHLQPIPEPFKHSARPTYQPCSRSRSSKRTNCLRSARTANCASDIPAAPPPAAPPNRTARRFSRSRKASPTGCGRYRSSCRKPPRRVRPRSTRSSRLVRP